MHAGGEWSWESDHLEPFLYYPAGEFDPVENCSECDRLWHEYANATIEQFQLQGRLRIATLETRRDDVQRLTFSVNAAAAAIERARVEMQRHETSHAAVQTASG